MKNETSEEPSKPVINNSSMITAENSSSLHSRLNQRRNKLIAIKEKKYSNTTLFENQKRDLSKSGRKKAKATLYLTDVTSSKFRDTDFETKSTLHSTKNYQTYGSTKNRNHKNFFKTKSSLPYITNYDINNNQNKKLDEQTYLEYFETMMHNKEYIKNIVKEVKDVKNKNLKKKRNKTFRDDKHEYIRKTNEIKRLKYELDLKKNAMEDFRENLKHQKNSFNYTISNIQAYKHDIENNFISKYNDTLRFLSRQIYNQKFSLDCQTNKLKQLKNDVNNLKQMIAKKESILKDIEKWIKLQIYMKEGKNPKDIKLALRKYEGKLIFNSMEELENNLSYKEYQNLRLLDKYNKAKKEKEKLVPLLQEEEKSYEIVEKNFSEIIEDKLALLNSLKKRELNLQLTINQLKNINKEPEEKKSNSTTNIIINKKKDIYDIKYLVNELGIKYKPTKSGNNIFNYIESIFYSFLLNEISGISLDINDETLLSNINLPESKKAIIQMNFIELSLNHLISNINNKISSDKNSLQIKEKTCKIIDAYRKMKNVNRNNLEMKKKRDNILKKVEKRANKHYVFSRGKVDYNIVLEEKNKEIERLKNKKHLKKIDIWDFLYDV